MDQQVEVGLVALGGVVVGSLFTLLGTLITARVNNRSAKQRQVQELAIRAGIAEYREARDALFSSGRKGIVFPMNSFIAANYVYMDALLNSEPGSESYKNAVLKMAQISEQIEKLISDGVIKDVKD